MPDPVPTPIPTTPDPVMPTPTPTPGPLPTPATRVPELEMPAAVYALLQSRCLQCHTYGVTDAAGWGSFSTSPA